MKRTLCVLMIFILFLSSSCGGEDDHVIDLLRETETFSEEEGEMISVIINKNSGTFHLDADCSYLDRMKKENRMDLDVKALDLLLSHGYRPCSRCAKKEIDILS